MTIYVLSVNSILNDDLGCSVKKAVGGMMYCKLGATLFYWLEAAVIYPLIG